MLSGSSPLTRGKLKQGLQHGRPEGLIPAHAGKTGSPPRRFSACPAHPRSRGENTLIRADDKKFEGSSPLTRGKHQRAQGPERTRGLIPAHAGKTTAVASKETADRAHPRSRGENRRHIQTHPGETGSSPLTRGKHLSARRCSRGVGLIPAHAGKTARCLDSGPARWAHPRSRGENTEADEDSRALWGSSPLTRGKHRVPPRVRRRRRLIPAHAGKTLTGMVADADAGAHPRSRGENSRPASASPWTAGSSPLTRGKRASGGARRGLRRLIPTHAGKTRRICGMGTRNWAHPHSRGENDSLPGCTSGWEGSSPLTRGKPRPGRVPGPPPRLIPTHAGKTSWPSSAPPESPAHPHSRGENPLMTLTLTAAGGLIPTHAGKTMVRRAHER